MIILYTKVFFAIRKQARVRPGQKVLELSIQAIPDTNATQCNSKKPNDDIKKRHPHFVKEEAVGPSTLDTHNQMPNVQNRVTRMLLLTTVVFFLTWIPAAFYYAISKDTLLYIRCSNPAGYAALSLIRDSRLINNATNPIIYSVANKRFRKDCRRLVNFKCFGQTD